MNKIPEDKKSEIYLKQISISDNEKVGEIVRLILEGALPLIDGKINLLEVGVGVGDDIRKIFKDTNKSNLFIYALDIIPENLDRLASIPRIIPIVSDLKNPPIKKGGLSGINLTSVLHEGISYNPDILTGKLSIENYLKGVFKIYFDLLTPGGYIFYKDIGLPNNFKEKQVIFYSKLLVPFMNKFLTKFATVFQALNNKIYSIEVLNEVGNLKITAPVHFHREIQRHLITYFDFLIVKTKNYSLRKYISSKNFKNIGEEEIYMELRDGLLDDNIFEEWFRREGFEIYTYMTLDGLLEIFYKSGLEIKVLNKSVFPRPEYDAFIGVFANVVIPDTKQRFIIQKTK